MPALPFEISREDPAFIAGLAALRARGSPLTEDQAFKVFGHVARYLIGMTDEVTRWWDKIEPYEIDMRFPATAVHNLILARCGLSERNMSPQLAEMREDFATDRPPETMVAENVYFQILIEDMKSDPVLRLAS